MQPIENKREIIKKNLIIYYSSIEGIEGIEPLDLMADTTIDIVMGVLNEIRVA